MEAAVTDECGDEQFLGLFDTLGSALAEASVLLRAHCMVEIDGGTVVGHALCADSAPAAFNEAVLHRDASRLARTVRDLRSVAVLPGGPLVAARLPGCSHRVLTAPLTAQGRRLGWLWLVTADPAVDVDAVSLASQKVVAAFTRAPQPVNDEPVLAALRGTGVLPAAVRAGASQVWVAAVAPVGLGISHQDLRTALFAVPPPDTFNSMHVVTDTAAEQLFIVITTADRAAADVRDDVQSFGADAARALSAQVQMALSEPANPGLPLDVAAAQARVALPHAPAGRCVLLQTVRSQVVLELLSPALSELPELGPDPVQQLMDIDLKRGTQYALSLLSWLDAQCDVRAASKRLQIHPNTLRYRLGRIQAMLRLNLESSDTCLELHLRLRRAVRVSSG